MITIRTGAPGNGKSLVTQGLTYDEFIFNRRDIVTSTPVRFMPWLLGSKAQIGLIEYIRQRNPDFPVPSLNVLSPGVVSFGHMLCVEDEKELGALFLWRRNRKTGEWFKLSWNEADHQFDPGQLALSRGNYIVTDEAWKCYNSRNWKDTAKVVEFYGRQHRKFGDDWDLISHSHKDLDTQLNRMCQEWQVCINGGLRRVSVFRAPSTFRVKSYYEPPVSSNAVCFRTQEFKLNPLLCQTYDTSGGVAVGGGRAADTSRRKKGIHWGYALAGFALIALGFVALPFLTSHVFKYGIHQPTTSVKKPASVVSPSPVPAAAGVPRSAYLAAGLSPLGIEEVNIVGLSPCFGSSGYLFYLSDGQSIWSQDSRVTFASPLKLVFMGRPYFWSCQPYAQNKLPKDH